MPLGYSPGSKALATENARRLGGPSSRLYPSAKSMRLGASWGVPSDYQGQKQLAEVNGLPHANANRRPDRKPTSCVARSAGSGKDFRHLYPDVAPDRMS